MSEFSVEFFGGPFDGDVIEMKNPPPDFRRLIYPNVSLVETKDRKPMLYALYQYRGGSYWFVQMEVG